MSNKKPKKKFYKKSGSSTPSNVDIYDFEYDVSSLVGAQSPYYTSVSTGIGYVPMTYTMPSGYNKDKKKFKTFIKQHDIKPLPPSESAVMMIDDGDGNKYSMLDLIEATDSPLNTVMYEVMINNFRSLQNINKKLNLICEKLKIGTEPNDKK